MEKLSFLGAGPKIARIMLPWLALTIVLTIMKKELFVLSGNGSLFIRDAGFIVLGAGLIFYFITVRGLLKGLKSTKLMTRGGYFLCQNPLYASIILLIIPGIALLSNSWLILTTSVVGYISFKLNIKSEYTELERVFGESYLKYKRETPEFFPFPIKKIFR